MLQPMVTGPSAVRFYAGAPLRNRDGYNIGSLCLVDTEPRNEFSPKDRITLRLFAESALHELDLARDRAELCAKDRIQVSVRSILSPMFFL